ncbi:MAG TPA: hypothetical protein VFK41_03595 [Nocardioidaceae bacterium]|nr:hypothetical protein [Nocardioidaceae bacterium]
MSLSDRPEPRVDGDPVRAPGGADADISESDVGAASEGRPVTPDPPLSAQQDDASVLDELAQPEESDPDVSEAEAPEEGGSEPTA